MLERCSRPYSFGGPVTSGCGTWDTQSWLMAVIWLLTCLFHPLLTAEIKSDLLLISSCPFDMRHPFFPRADPWLPHLPGATQPITSLRGPSPVTASLQVFSEHISFGEHCSGAPILKSSKGAFSNRMCHCAEVWGCSAMLRVSGPHIYCGFPSILFAMKKCPSRVSPTPLCFC